MTGPRGLPGETRARIIDAAASLIPEVGWTGATSRKVAERAGVLPGVIHYHVRSIDELRRRAAVGRVRAFFLDGFEQVRGSANPSAFITAVFDALASGDAIDPDVRILTEALVAAGRDEELRREVAMSVAELRDACAEWFADHGVPLAVPLAATLVTAIDGFLVQRILDPTLDPAPIVAGLIAIAGAGESCGQPPCIGWSPSR